MKKLLGLALSLVFFFSLVLVVSAQGSPEIPERNGDYPVPGRPDLRVRVFVHGPEAKPSTALACSDANSSKVDKLASWHLSGTVNYKVNTSVPFGISNFKNTVGIGFNTWKSSIVSSSKPVLSYVETTSKNTAALDNENIIAFGTTSSSALGVTYIWYNTLTHEAVEVDTILNDSVPWANGCDTSKYDVANILVHEQGHWFGLDDNYGRIYANNTMYGYGSKGETKKITLTQGDITAINKIYQ